MDTDRERYFPIGKIIATLAIVLFALISWLFNIVLTVTRDTRIRSVLNEYKIEELKETSKENSEDLKKVYSLIIVNKYKLSKEK